MGGLGPPGRTGVRGRGKTTNASTTVEEWPFEDVKHDVKHMESV